MARHIHMTAVSGDLTGTKAGSGEDAGARGASVSAVLDAFDRAEGLLIDVLGQTDRDGACRWDTAWWEEVLDHAASLHARMLCARARLEQCGRGGWPPATERVPMPALTLLTSPSHTARLC